MYGCSTAFRSATGPSGGWSPARRRSWRYRRWRSRCRTRPGRRARHGRSRSPRRASPPGRIADADPCRDGASGGKTPRMPDDVSTLDATAQAALVRTGQVSPRELVESAIRRLEALNPRLNAVIHTCFERALRAAAAPDLPAGPFRGVPFLMKDIGGPEAGEPNHAGMRFLKEAGWREP